LKGRIKFYREGVEYIRCLKSDKIDVYGAFKWKNGDKYENIIMEKTIKIYL